MIILYLHSIINIIEFHDSARTILWFGTPKCYYAASILDLAYPYRMHSLIYSLSIDRLSISD